jgi:hypothetical protein
MDSAVASSCSRSPPDDRENRAAGILWVPPGQDVVTERGHIVRQIFESFRAAMRLHLCEVDHHLVRTLRSVDLVADRQGKNAAGHGAPSVGQHPGRDVGTGYLDSTG